MISRPVIGVDPGACGAIWVAGGGEPPTFALVDCGSPTEVADALRSVLVAYADAPDAPVAAVERNHASPIMGRQSAFTFGVSWGVVRGALAALEVPVTLVTAQKWRAWALAGRGVPKERADREAMTLEAARDRWPMVEWPKSKAKAQAVACAAFIAAFAAREAE